ncbi:MAG: hypothetical protein U5N85_11330 [Arcicella sp.]|nr:hypothetical protein [Arcicella sp.]
MVVAWSRSCCSPVHSNKELSWCSFLTGEVPLPSDGSSADAPTCNAGTWSPAIGRSTIVGISSGLAAPHFRSGTEAGSMQSALDYREKTGLWTF